MGVGAWNLVTGWWQGGKGGVTLSLIRGRCYKAWHQVLSVVQFLPVPTHLSPKRLLYLSHEMWGVLCWYEGLLVAGSAGKGLQGSGVCRPQVGATTRIPACTGLHGFTWFLLGPQYAQERRVSLVTVTVQMKHFSSCVIRSAQGPCAI